MKKVKRILKKAGIIIIIVFLSLIMLATAGHWLNKIKSKVENDELEISVKYNPQNTHPAIDEKTIPDEDYRDSLEAALKMRKKDKEEQYQNHIDEVIKEFENDDYVTVYFKSIKDSNTECFTMAKFKKKIIEGQVRYVFMSASPVESKKGANIGKLESVIEAQLALSDYVQNLNIDPESTRFVFGDCKSEQIYNLKVEGQEPTGIVPYDHFGETWYFWYYENLDSDVAGNQLTFTLE